MILTAKEAAAVEAPPITLHLFCMVHDPPAGPTLVSTSPDGHAVGMKDSLEWFTLTTLYWQAP